MPLQCIYIYDCILLQCIYSCRGLYYGSTNKLQITNLYFNHSYIPFSNAFLFIWSSICVSFCVFLLDYAFQVMFLQGSFIASLVVICHNLLPQMFKRKLNVGTLLILLFCVGAMFTASFITTMKSWRSLGILHQIDLVFKYCL